MSVKSLASIEDGIPIAVLNDFIENRECDRYVKRESLGSFATLVVNIVVDREEVVYFKELCNQKTHLLDEDISGHSSSKIDLRLEEQISQSVECVLEKNAYTMQEIGRNQTCPSGKYETEKRRGGLLCLIS